VRPGVRPDDARDDTGAGLRGPRVGIWGTFDVANFGDLLFPRIFEQELRRRLPDAVVRAYSPLGHLHPIPMAGGMHVESLGRPTADRLARLAGELDLVAIGGGDIIHPRDDLYALWYGMAPADAEPLRPSSFFVDGLGRRLETSTPTAWHAVGVPFDLEGEFAKRVRRACSRRAYLAVRDERSRRRLVAAGVDREVALVPDSAFVVDRVFPRADLAARHRRLVAGGAYPGGASPLVVQGGASLRPHLDEIGRSLSTVLAEQPAVPVVLLETGLCHRDDEFADAVARYLDPTRVHRLPRGFVVDDVVAAIAHSRGFLGSSLHGCISAHVFDRPFAVLDLLGQSKLSSLVDLTGDGELVSSGGSLAATLRALLEGRVRHSRQPHLRSLVDAHFDRLATLAQTGQAGSSVAPRGEGRLARLPRAARQRRR
jgi:polysaccharide pyruvyl transferase WcaK-like protein